MTEIEEWEGKRPNIPEGNYSLVCINAKRAIIGIEGKGGWGKIQKIVLWFHVFEGDYAGTLLPAFIAMPEHKISMGTKFYHFWVIANGCRRPSRIRFKDMPLSKFINKVFLASVVTVKPKYPDGTDKQEAFHYSRVDHLKELLVGDPKS